ncbi:glycosyltransferase family 9 protein [Vallicoccus soli]|uniref:Glycosyltransferase family 9 protein n=1 Tax=Vallicoccus soli TaxID=2339232 RepID=A0A3A3YR76_9ACTN|nr:glycosyltransferase family 9 protein [Vallicoccus soli]
MRPGLEPADPVPGVRRVAVLRSGGIGDYLNAEPALTALRAAYPQAEITLLGAAHHRPLVEGRPGPCDRLEVVPAVPGVRAGDGPDAPGEEVEAWCAAQRARGYDLAVQLHGGGGNSNPLLLRLGARTTAGTAAPGAPRLDRTVPWSPYQHDVLRWLEVAAAAGAPAVRLEPRLALTEDDLRRSREALPDGEPFVAVHPGATEPRRRWRPERLAEVGDALAAEGARVVLLGSPAERPLTAQVAAAARSDRWTDLTGAVDLRGLLGLLARADLLLGNDSGPRHLAAALGTPTVAVFTSANAVDVAPLTRTWHRTAVSWGSACARCGMPYLAGDCGHGETVLDDVPGEEVLAHARDLLAQRAVPA